MPFLFCICVKMNAKTKCLTDNFCTFKQHWIKTYLCHEKQSYAAHPPIRRSESESVGYWKCFWRARIYHDESVPLYRSQCRVSARVVEQTLHQSDANFMICLHCTGGLFTMTMRYVTDNFWYGNSWQYAGWQWLCILEIFAFPRIEGFLKDGRTDITTATKKDATNKSHLNTKQLYYIFRSSQIQLLFTVRKVSRNLTTYSFWSMNTILA
jgi:hypothetical protein